MKKDKGEPGGSCNRQVCQEPGAVYYNHSTHKYYCPKCAELLNRENEDWANRTFNHDLCTKKEVQNEKDNT